MFPQVSRTFKIGNREVGWGCPVFMTAEIGAAHCGRFDDLLRMIRAAAEAGCDGADIFMADPNGFYYRAMSNGHDYIRDWNNLYFTDEQWAEAIKLGEELGIVVYPTPLDRISVKRCAKLGIKMCNINSDDVNNYLLLQDIAKLGVPVSMHDIDQTLAEVESAVKTLRDNGAHDIIVLHSTLESGNDRFAYETANLEVINTYRQAFGGLGVLAGCVEHTKSDFLINTVAAFRPALISKHIQIDPRTNPNDPKISINIDRLGQMVHELRMSEMALGTGMNQRVIKSDGTIPARTRNKVLVSDRFIPKGKIIEAADIVGKRPGDYGGLHPSTARFVIGSRALEDIPENTKLSLSMFTDYQDPEYKFPESENHIEIIKNKADNYTV